MFTKQKNAYKTKKLQTRYVYKTKYKRKVYKHVMFKRQNKCLQNKCLQNKTKIYKHVIFIKQNKNVHTSYAYKTKQYRTKVLQNTLC